jgi:hypothetical protein
VFDDFAYAAGNSVAPQHLKDDILGAYPGGKFAFKSHP